jgi:hypothetical protein
MPQFDEIYATVQHHKIINYKIIENHPEYITDTVAI